MNENPRISVLMPAYNTEKYIAEAIESILNQTFQDFEFIIIDDGSTDETWQTIQRYAAKDLRIKTWQHEKNEGISITRNDLVAAATAPYVVWQDSDDISLPYRLKLQVEYMEAHPEVGISGGYLTFFSETKELGIRRYATEDRELRRMIFRYSPLSQGAAIIRKVCFEGLEMYDVNWSGAEDLHMSFKIGRNWKFGNVTYVLIRYRIQEQSATFSKLRDLELMTLRARWSYRNSSAYRLGFVDIVYNLAQLLTLFLMPRKSRIALFNLIRNGRSTQLDFYV